MKKIILLGICFTMLLSQMIFIVKAEEYLSYQEIIFEEDTATLLKEFSEKEYTNYLKEITKKKFMGWKIEVVNLNEKVEFVSETKLKIYNNGYSTIKHDITLTSKEETKYQISVSGSMDISIKGDIKKFKGSLDADIKASISYSKTSTTSENYEFKIIVDPGTYVSIITRGKGEVNNGVGKYYFFWIQTKKGGWETFTITTEYYEIVKEKI